MKQEDTKFVFGITVPVDLDRNGLENDRPIEKPENFNPELIALVRAFIQDNFQPSQWITKHGFSYSLKHTVERRIDRYVSNGDLILAMIAEGYQFKRIGRSLNCWFNLKKHNL
jgi:hypothetical protein